MNIFSKNSSTLNSTGIKYLKLGTLVFGLVKSVGVGDVVAVEGEVVLIETVDVHILLTAANVDGVSNENLLANLLAPVPNYFISGKPSLLFSSLQKASHAIVVFRLFFVV